MYLEKKTSAGDLAMEYCPGQQSFSHKDEWLYNKYHSMVGNISILGEMVFIFSSFHHHNYLNGSVLFLFLVELNLSLSVISPIATESPHPFQNTHL